jgi:hypothetical protein
MLLTASTATKWTINLFINVLLTMVMIYVIKKVTKKFDIPVLKQVVDEV